MKGKIRKFEDVWVVIDLLKEKTGKLYLTLSREGSKLVLCYDGTLFYVEGDDVLDEEFSLKSFVEKWFLSGGELEFNLVELEPCGLGKAISYEKLQEILRNPFLKEIVKIPDPFEISYLDARKSPQFLVSYWTAGRPVTRWDVYREGYTLSDLVRFIHSGILKIRPYKKVESLPAIIRLPLIGLAAAVLLSFFIPFELQKLNLFYLNEAVNWGLKEKVLGRKNGIPLPVLGCANRRFYFLGDRVVNPGIDGKFNTGDDVVFPLPKEGFVPTFCRVEK